jgi:hypothetical protein
MIGEPSIDMSMRPPQWRSTRIRPRPGQIAIAHSITSSIIGRLPR